MSTLSLFIASFFSLITGLTLSNFSSTSNISKDNSFDLSQINSTSPSPNVILSFVIPKNDSLTSDLTVKSVAVWSSATIAVQV